ncbi:MAG: hypothetical protein SNJ78_01900 [Spirochaetales bacterium]
MEVSSMWMLLSRLIVGAGATFFAILLWSKTRELGWIMVIVGILLGYVEVIYTALKQFGVVSPTLGVVQGIPLLELGLVNLPLISITIGLIVTISRHPFR